MRPRELMIIGMPMIHIHTKSFGQFHDSVDGVIASFSKSLHSLGAGAFGVFNDHLDVVRGQAFLVEVFCCLFNLGSFSSRDFNLRFFRCLRHNRGFELIDFVLSGLESVHVGFSEDDVRIFISGGFPDIGVIDANDKGFSLLDGNSINAGDGFESHLAHGLLKLFLSSVGFKVSVVVFVFSFFMFMLMIMLTVLAVHVFMSMLMLMLVFFNRVFSLNFLSHHLNQQLNINQYSDWT